MATNLLYFGDFKLVKKLECRKDGKACVSASHLVQHEQMHSFEEPKVLFILSSEMYLTTIPIYISPIYISLGIQAGEGNGTPLQYSCLENPMDRGAW